MGVRDVLQEKTKIFPAPRGALQRRSLEISKNISIAFFFYFI